jgi:3D-(3,5/4)-trihydroxycyclohexane-1,2-dione acylhydrolase (decyclizing)
VVPVDFAKNAESLGAVGLTATNERELRDALDKARSADRTTLISVRVPFEPQVPSFESWWDVPVAEVSEQESVQEARAGYEERQKNQRVFV